MNKKIRVLFVDDETHILKALERTLRKSDLEFVCMASPLAALNLIKKEKFSIIVSDYRMEEMSGLVFLKKSKEILPEAKRIILSGYAEDNLIFKALEIDEVHKYFLKPMDTNLLISEIGLLLGLPSSKPVKTEAT